ncbi:MAG: methylenetetrahydrofolate--tRNA-(uracil(54)-C(5))-methyltransferase (FADH(2)-oxidizing) TrmFO [Heliobacteriaceae bacterium]|nr:methylenetetrahydrofolate--tRNA-(uracil(54)-C(5))-methyltransferase (FADH(2)-oxidizing) TrmFO [Heliobacteriaceae bacterium]
MKVMVIGAGLAGAEATWQIVRRGIPVRLFEMRPGQMTPAHKTGDFAELVCSNSFRGAALENAVGLLKEEMRRLGSLIMLAANEHQVAAGGALAVDRDCFARAITQRLVNHPLVEVVREEVRALPEEGIIILATGPLTSPALAAAITKWTGEDQLYFYDAAAPIITGDSIDPAVAFWGSRYGKGTADYLNCPFNEAEYARFYQELVDAEVCRLKEFEREVFFEGCMPIEVMARRGRQTLLYGPLKPVGLATENGERPYAVVQLRKENREGTLFNLVGFQTNLKWPEQQRVFRLIPGLERAEFVRYGFMHRNTFINGAALLLPTFQLRRQPNILFAGQITGVEGYVESAASGLVAGVNASLLAQGSRPVCFPPETAIGALPAYITSADPRYFQPMKVNYGLFPPVPGKLKGKRQRNEAQAQRALAVLAEFSPQVPPLKERADE